MIDFEKLDRLFEVQYDENKACMFAYVWAKKKESDELESKKHIKLSDAFNKVKDHKWHFYPDFIICDKDNKIWIIETKGGENTEGESKNIDIKVENKFEALKQYANKYNVNWGFVRDYDKNDSLYLCNTEYTEDMENENWKLLSKIFN